MSARPLVLGCIADDYTGASDLANTLTREGLRTVQTIGIPADDLALPETDAVVVALKIRSAPAATAVARAREAADWLRGRGAAHLLYKICSTFDSTDQGNIGPVTEALAEAMDETIVPVTPAFPATGRRVFQGHLFVGRQKLDESPLKDHPLNPMRESDLTRVLGRQSRGEVGLVPFEIVEAGEAAIAECLQRLAAEGKRAAIVDAAAERHLTALGAAAIRHKVTTGASGLGLGLARAAIAAGLAQRHDTRRTNWPAVGGRQAILAGSCSAATRSQIARAEAAMTVRHLDIEALTAGPAGVAEALDWAAKQFDRGPVLLATSAAPEAVARLKSKLGADVGARIEHAIAEIAAGLVARGVRRLVVAGGETSGAVADRLGIRALEIGPELAPGVPLMRRLDGPEPLLVALKSGNFGGPDFFRDALAAMR